MADIEKVVKGLEYCISSSCKLCSSDCPYFENEVCCIDEMQKDALEILKCLLPWLR